LFQKSQKSDFHGSFFLFKWLTIFSLILSNPLDAYALENMHQRQMINPRKFTASHYAAIPLTSRVGVFR